MYKTETSGAYCPTLCSDWEPKSSVKGKGNEDKQTHKNVITDRQGGIVNQRSSLTSERVLLTTGEVTEI